MTPGGDLERLKAAAPEAVPATLPSFAAPSAPEAPVEEAAAVPAPDAPAGTVAPTPAALTADQVDALPLAARLPFLLFRN